jgi:hypothetical protein
MTMTIEIKQLIIRAVVGDRRDRPAGTRGPRTPAAARAVDHPALRDVAADREALVDACARQVLRELRKERGR